MTKPTAKAEVPHNSGATSILVWNGLVTRMRLIGDEKRSRAHVDVDSSLEQGERQRHEEPGRRSDTHSACGSRVVLPAGQPFTTT